MQVALGYLFILCFNRVIWHCVPSGGAAGTDESSNRTEDKGEERGQFRYMTESLCSCVVAVAKQGVLFHGSRNHNDHAEQKLRNLKSHNHVFIEFNFYLAQQSQIC